MIIRERIFDFLKEHCVALGVAFVVGLLSALPVILAPLALQGEYQGIQFLYLDDETTYRARIQEILDGHPNVVSPFLYEYKEGRSAVPSIGEFFYAIPAFLFGLSGAIVFAKFFFPALLFFLVYFLVRQLGRGAPSGEGVMLSIATGMLVVLGFDLANPPVIISWLLRDSFFHLLPWTRLVNPITGALLLFSVALISWRLFAGRVSVWLAVTLGVLLGLTMGYFFTLASAFALVGILFLLTLYSRERERAWIFFASLFLGILVSLPYWITIFTSIAGEEGKEFALRNGMTFTHAPVLNKILLVASLFAALSFFVFRKYRMSEISVYRKEWQFVFALLLAGWMVFNQQVVTGREVWVDHFIQYTIPFSMVSILVVSHIVWRGIFPRSWNIAMVVIIFASIVLGVFSATSFHSRMPDFLRIQKEYGQLFSWLGEHAERDCVVFINDFNEELERLIPAYTRCNVYTSSYVYTLPEERILHNLLLRMRMLGVEPGHAKDFLYAHEVEVRSYLFEDWSQMHMVTQGRDEWLRSVVSDTSESYDSMSASTGELLRAYRVDYLYSEKPIAPLIQENIGGLSIATSSEQFVLYHVE